MRIKYALMSDETIFYTNIRTCIDEGYLYKQIVSTFNYIILYVEMF